MGRSSQPGKAGASLAGSDELARALFEQTTEGILIGTQEGEILDVNQHSCDMLAYSRRELLARSLTEILSPGAPEQTHATLEALQPGGTLSREYGLHRKDGRIVYTQFSIRKLPSGKLLCMAHDITDRVLAEQKYRAVFENAAEGLFQSTPRGRFLQVNPAMARIFGYESPEAMLREVTDITRQLHASPGQRKQFLQALEKNDLVERFIGKYRRKDGSSIWLSISARTVRNDKGRIRYFEGFIQDITDSRLAEIALQESEEKYRTLFRNSALAIGIRNPDGGYIEFNDAYSRMLGYSQEELLTLTTMDITHPEDKPVSRGNMQAVAEGRAEVRRYEKRYIHKDGSIVWGDVNVQPLKSADGKIIGLLGTVVDITERKKMEEELRKSQRQLESIFRAAPVGIGVVAQRVLIAGNKRLCEMTGYDWSELSNQSARILYPTQEEFEFVGQEKYRQIAITGTGTVETRWQKKDGTIIHVLLSSSPIDPADLVRGVTFTALDITERKQTEDALRESEEKYRSLFNQSVEGIYLHEIDGRILDVNQMASIQSGYTRDELLQLNIFDLQSDVFDREDILQQWNRWQLGQRFTIEGKHKRKDGTTYPVEVSTGLISHGGRILMLAIVHNISERKQAEELLRESEERYRQIVEASPLGIHIYELDKDGRLIFSGANPGADTILGVEHIQFIGLTLEEAFPPLADTDVPSHYRQAACEGTPWKTEEIQYEHGKIKGAFQVFAFQTGKNRVTVMFQDITERKWAEQTLKEQTDELEALFSVSTTLRTVRSTDEMLPVVLKEMRRVLDADAGAIVLLDTDQSHFTIMLSDGLLAANTGLRFPSSEGLSGKVFRTHQPCVVEDISQAPDRLPGVIGEETLGPEAIVPLQSETEMLGVLIAERKKGAPRFSPEDIRLLSVLGEMTGNTLRRTRLYDQALNRQERLQSLHNIDLAITSSVDPRVTLDVLLAEVTTHLRVDAADVLLFNPQTYLLEFTSGRGLKSQGSERIRLGDGITGRVASERRALGLTDISKAREQLANRKLLEAERFTAYHGAPMISKGQVIGVLEVFHKSPIEATPDWVEFLEAVATQAAIAIDNAQMFENLQHANFDLSLAYDATIEGWSRALDLRDKETEGHSQRVTEMTLQLARELNVSQERLIHIRRGSLLHDIGKMGISDTILLKPGPLTEEEWVIMRKHPEYAYDLLSPITYLRPALDIPYCHHERWNGSGYPRGLKEEQIPLAARIFAVVDVWDAITNDRPYRPAWPVEKARSYLYSQAGKELDPQIVNAFFRKRLMFGIS